MLARLLRTKVLNKESLTDERPSDVYAWAITAFEVMSGEPAWPSMSPQQILAAVLQNKRPEWPLDDIHASAPALAVSREDTGVVSIVESAWQQDPSTRPTFEELVLKCSKAAAKSRQLSDPEGRVKTIWVVVSTSEVTFVDEAGNFKPEEEGGTKVEVMKFVEALAKANDSVIFGYDWAGSSSEDVRDTHYDESIRRRYIELNGVTSPVVERSGKIDWGDMDSVADSYWFKGYCERIKGEVLVLAQMGYHVMLTCIEGGPITQLEAATMERLRDEITRDLAGKGVEAQDGVPHVQVRTDTFNEFKRRFARGRVIAAARTARGAESTRTSVLAVQRSVEEV